MRYCEMSFFPIPSRSPYSSMLANFVELGELVCVLRDGGELRRGRAGGWKRKKQIIAKEGGRQARTGWHLHEEVHIALRRAAEEDVRPSRLSEGPCCQTVLPKQLANTTGLTFTGSQLLG